MSEACAYDGMCATPAAYWIDYDFGGDPDLPLPMCADHTAELRANDPRGYIASVSSLRATPEVTA